PPPRCTCGPASSMWRFSCMCWMCAPTGCRMWLHSWTTRCSRNLGCLARCDGADADPEKGVAMTESPRITPVPGRPSLLLGGFDIGDLGYVADEFFVSGTATSYTPISELSPDGCWQVTPSGTAEYTTRIVALTPTDPARFNGTVLVEWLNVSGGIDAPAVWMMAHREILRAGYAYVAVSAQKVGVDGGASMLGMDMSLKSQDPTRYASLGHPGDAFCYDIFSQTGGLVRSADDAGILRGLRAEHTVAVGESQSAMFLTTYINPVDP